MGIFDSISKFFRAEAGKPADKSIDRNDPCWCGSGIKYKKCHMDKDLKVSTASSACCSGAT